ncbi:MAG: outer membrane beta-barrel protein [Burkholderiales bacterium]|nr:outer membrane beta-barrel protein [Burkholderiales bacterium]
MKKILATLLAVSSVAAFADTFQDFNNNAYLSYGLATPLQGYGSADGSQQNMVGLGATFQTKNNIWANASVAQGNYAGNNDANTNSGNTFLNIRAGYAFQFFGNDTNGFQVIPYASFGAVNNNNYTWGVGAQPEYRFLKSLKVSMGLGVLGANGTQFNATGNSSTTSFGFNVNPEVQYDIAQMVMVSVGYNYISNFNTSQPLVSNALTAKVGYLF